MFKNIYSLRGSPVVWEGVPQIESVNDGAKKKKKSLYKCSLSPIYCCGWPTEWDQDVFNQKAHL